VSVPPLVLLPEMTVAGCHRLLSPFRVLWRGNRVYRLLLRGPLTDRIAITPWDALPRRLEDADQLLRGRFRFHGESVDMKYGVSVFDLPPPSRAWAEALHGFEWLPPLARAGGEPARLLATNLIAQWVARHGSYGEPAWLAPVMARRLINIFCHGAVVIANSDMLWRSRLFVSLRDQAQMLARIVEEAPEGLPRLEAAAALALSGLCLDDESERTDRGLARLESECLRQILPDGGHASRSPEALLCAYRLLVMVLETLEAAHQEPPHTLRNTHDRMAPMLRFFRHGDGGLALFNGGQESDGRMITVLLTRDAVRGALFNHARHSGYQRLAAGRSLVLMDCGRTPEGVFATQAHAGFCSMEFGSGAHRIVVNCGAGGLGHTNWDQPLRATAAHSTLTLADTSSAQVLPAGIARDLLGARLLGGPVDAQSRRSETAQGWMVEASHDAWVPPFGVRHERRITLSPEGGIVTGEDRLVPVAGRSDKPLPFAVRFHIHPDVRVSPLEGGNILLKLPGGEGWRFRAGGTVAVEESVYLGGAAVRRGEQLVLTGTVGDGPVEIAWVFEQIVA
jgi:uncharacterized heparinase superfamily protein